MKHTLHLICTECWHKFGRPIVGRWVSGAGCCWCGGQLAYFTEFGPGILCEDVHLEDVT